MEFIEVPYNSNTMNKREYINPLAIGTRLIGSDNKRYRITKVLGQGTFGITYQATTTGEISGQLGRVQVTTTVAIKEFFMRDVNDRNGTNVVGITGGGMCDKYRRGFAREARNLSHLDHRHIVHVTDSFEYNNTSYFVMEYCDAGSLDDYIIGKGQLSESEALYFFRQIADALSYMHAHRMLHLDLKPANVVLRYNDDDDSNKPDAVLVDFGLSKQYTADGQPESSTSIGLGTPGYAPMEQANHRDDSKEFAATLDVYALGATLFKMLTGTAPDNATTLYNYGFPTHQLQACNVSPSLIRCIAKAMAPAVRDRYQSVSEFAQAVGGGEATRIDDSRQDDKTHIHETDIRYDTPDDEIEAVIVEDPTPVEEQSVPPTPEPRQRNAWILSILAGIAAILAIFVGVDRCQSHQGEAEASYTASGYINGHEYVDLGLSVKWATCNVGASSASDWGNYYAWGETTTKTEYNYGECATWQKNLGDISGDSRYDAARRNWGGSWRMPTKAECQELVDNCTWTWTTQGGHNGYRVTSKKNGNSVFLPAAGYRNGSSLYGQGESGYYWSSTPYEGYTESAYYLLFFSSYHSVDWRYRDYGRTVRPVSE